MLRVAAITVLGLSLGAGVASAAPGDGSIDNTGPDSNNQITFNNDTDVDVDNDNDVRVRNHNPQDADSGDARVHHNTTGGDATSGDATNDSLLRATVRLSNTGAGVAALGNGGNGGSTGSIDTTGPDSNNQITFNNGFDVDVDNDNDVTVENWNDQDADSGDATVSDNTTGGNATSGDASNISTTEVTVEVNN